MEELIKELNSPDEVERIYAAQDIAETNNPDMAVHLFDRLTNEESQAVRDAIVFALRNLPCSGIYARLFELFRSPDAYLRNAVIGIFGSEGDEAVSFLYSHINHADGEVRKLILDALFAAGVPDAIQVIRSALNDPSMNVQITAVEYLGRLEDRESVSEMIELIRKETEPMLRISVLESLCLVGDRADIMNVFSILADGGDFIRIDPVCLPQVIRLSAKTGDPEVISGIADTINDIEIYAEDVIHAIEEAEQEFKGICRKGRIPGLIRKIMEKTEDEELHTLCKELICW
ncbi:HEAT repeat domain-containing protein [Desulfobacterales bacterium HSG2]|nr:HEAT repeat domain-containing protein [Desulfobacterales bacterium HSG2]